MGNLYFLGKLTRVSALLAGFALLSTPSFGSSLDSTPIAGGGSGGSGGVSALTGDVSASGTGTVSATVSSIGGKPVSLGGALTTTGAVTLTGPGSVTLPASGTLATNAQVQFAIPAGTSTTTPLCTTGTAGVSAVCASVSLPGGSLIGGWVPTLGVRDDSPATVTGTNTGFAAGDVLTLNDGCSTHSILVVVSVTSGGITNYNITGRGACATAPANPVPILSSTGSSTNATFTLLWAPVVSSVAVANGVFSNGGNLIMNGRPPLSYNGGESVLLGPLAGNNIGTGNFNTIVGLSAAGSINGCATNPIYVAASTNVGTDNLRNTCGHGNVDTFGVDVLYTYNQAGTSSNRYLFGTAAFGQSSMYYWNAPISFPFNSAFGFQACKGASSGTVNFVGILCVGQNTGLNLTSASNSILISGGSNGQVGAVNFASGTGVLLVATGRTPIDTPAASTSGFINLDNAYIASTTGISYGSGFGSNAGFASGNSTKYFSFSVGTGGTASTGVINFANAAPVGWNCFGHDKSTTPTGVQFFYPTSATSVTVTNRAFSTGAATPWPSGAQLQISCDGG